ncbi:aromatic amino acid lyase [Patescibacteria group bacterium]
MINEVIKKSRQTLKPKSPISLSGDQNLSIPEIISVANNNASVEVSPSEKTKARLRNVYQNMMAQVKNGVPVYGATTAYGGQADLVLTEGVQQERLTSAKALSKSIIHIDVSTGDPIPKNITKAAMLIRINMLLLK